MYTRAYPDEPRTVRQEAIVRGHNGAARQMPVDVGLSRLEHEIEELTGALGELRKRLDAIMAPMQEMKDPGTVIPPAQSAPMCERIERSSAVVVSLKCLVVGILGSLEV